MGGRVAQVSHRRVSRGCDPTLWHERDALGAALAVGLLHAEEVVTVNGEEVVGAEGETTLGVRHSRVDGACGVAGRGSFVKSGYEGTFA